MSDTFNLLFSLLRLNPAKRLTAREALDQRYFTTAPLPARPGTQEYDQTYSSFEEWPGSHELSFGKTYRQVELPPHYDAEYRERGEGRGRRERRDDGDRDRKRGRRDRRR